MPDKYLATVGGHTVQKEATATSAGAADAGKIVALDANGKLPNSMLTIGAESKSVEASETLAAGDIVNVYDDSGTAKVRKADATTAGKQAVGFVLDSVTSGQSIEVHFEGQCTNLTGLTPGATVWLSTTAGEVTETAPSASGNVVQIVGIAVSATEISFERSQPITLV